MSFAILQFGASRFLQAHVDLFVAEALKRGEAIGEIIAVQTTANPTSRRRIEAFAKGTPYRVRFRGLTGAMIDREVVVDSRRAGGGRRKHAGRLAGAQIPIRVAGIAGLREPTGLVNMKEESHEEIQDCDRSCSGGGACSAGLCGR